MGCALGSALRNTGEVLLGASVPGNQVNKCMSEVGFRINSDRDDLFSGTARGVWFPKF
jgi:hypothetical protein